MTGWKKAVTLTLLASFALVLVGWDIYVVGWGAPDAQDSISRNVLRVFSKYPTLNLVLGFILGHLFWPQKKPLTDEELLATVASRGLKPK